MRRTRWRTAAQTTQGQRPAGVVEQLARRLGLHRRRRPAAPARGERLRLGGARRPARPASTGPPCTRSAGAWPTPATALVVRVPAVDPVWIGAALDAGADRGRRAVGDRPGGCRARGSRVALPARGRPQLGAVRAAVGWRRPRPGRGERRGALPRHGRDGRRPGRRRRDRGDPGRRRPVRRPARPRPRAGHHGRRAARRPVGGQPPRPGGRGGEAARHPRGGLRRHPGERPAAAGARHPLPRGDHGRRRRRGGRQGPARGRPTTAERDSAAGDSPRQGEAPESGAPRTGERPSGRAPATCAALDEEGGPRCRTRTLH